MTVAITTATSGPYSGNGGTVAFPFTFKVLSTSEVAVYADGALVSPSLYTVTLATSGGTVTFTTAPANGVAILIVSDPSFLQDAAFQNNGAFLPEVVEGAYDRAAVRDISLKARVDKLLSLAMLAAAREGYFLSWDGAGNPVLASGTGADSGLRTDLAASSGAALVASPYGGTVRDILTPSPKAFGVTGNGVADDTVAIQAWADYCSNNGIGTITDLTLTCSITDTVTFNGGANAGNIDVSTISFVYSGAKTKPAIRVLGTLRKSLRFGSITAALSGTSWDNVAYIGLQLKDIYGSKIYCNEISGFTEGREWVSNLSYGVGYNDVHGGSIRDCKYQEVLRTTSANGFVNENNFYACNYGNTSASDAMGIGYAVFLTWDKASSYRGHNNNRWWGPNFELGQPAGGLYRAPFYFDGVGANNHCFSARSERNQGPFAILDGGGSAQCATQNSFDIGFNSNVAQTNALLQVNSAWGNVMTSPASKQHSWQSPDLRTLLSTNGGANAPYLSGPMFLMETSVGTPSRTGTLAGHVATGRDAIHLIASGIFTAIDTTLIKTFRANLNCVSGFGGRLMIVAFDSTGARLTGNCTDVTWGNEQYVKSFASLVATTDYGGGYESSGDNDSLDLYFTVRAEVAKIYVGYIGGTAALAARQISITGYGEDETAANVTALTSMRVFADLDDPGTQRLSTAKPDTAGTHGYFEKGSVVFNASATASAAAGWQCSTAGWLAAAWASTTAYPVIGRIVTNDTGKMYELITAGTSAGSGGPTGTGTNITDGTCHWKYIGVKAAFVTLAVTS